MRLQNLGYATTAFRAQGATVDTAHAIVTGPSMTREVLYVAMTRARRANRVYVATAATAEPLDGFDDAELTGRGVLEAVLSHVGAATSAHEVRWEEAETASSIRTLAAEYETLAHAAEAPWWLSAFRQAGLADETLAQVEASAAFGALLTSLRRGEALGVPVARALPRLVERLDGSVDVAAVLHERVQRLVGAAGGHVAGERFVVGLVPVAGRVSDDEARTALDERARLMEERAGVLVERAIARRASWLAEVGPIPVEAAGRARWLLEARVVAAGRELRGERPHAASGFPSMADDVDAPRPVVHSEPSRWRRPQDEAPSRGHDLALGR